MAFQPQQSQYPWLDASPYEEQVTEGLDNVIPEEELYQQPTARQSDYQITPEQEEQIQSKLRDFKDLSQASYDSWEPLMIDRYQKYQASEDYYNRLFPRLAKVSSYTTTDIADIIEWALPSIIKSFLGTDEICEIKGVTSEDDHNAEIMRELINYQLTKKNNAMMLFYSWFKDALITGLGVIKVQWEREEADIETKEIVNPFMLQAMMNNGIQVTGAEQLAPNTYEVSYLKPATIKNQPLIENLRFSELRFINGYSDLQECPFVAHVKRTSISNLRQKEKEGIYSNIEEALEKGGTIKISDRSALDEIIDSPNAKKTGNNDKPSTFAEKSVEEVELWECFVKIDIDGDGIAEDWIITTVNDVFIRAERNTYGQAPFFIVSPYIDPHTLVPNKSYADMVSPIQDLKTAFTRQLIYNVAQSNDPKIFVNEQAVNLNDLNNNKQYIRYRNNQVNGEVFKSVPPIPISPATLPMMEMLEAEKEQRTGITRYNQGMDASSLNKTATGISAIMSASQQRLELVIRIFSETGVKNLLEFLVKLNQKFYNQEQVIRLTNKEMVIRPDDIQGQFDLTVSSGAGLSTKEADIMNYNTLMQMMMQLYQSGIGVVTPANIYYTLKKYIERLGFKNTETFVTPPAEVQKYQALEIMAMQQLYAMLPPQIQQAVDQALEATGGAVSPELVQFLLQVAPMLNPQAQQLIQILFGGTNPNELQPAQQQPIPNTVRIGNSPTVSGSQGNSGVNTFGNAFGDNKSFVAHDY